DRHVAGHDAYAPFDLGVETIAHLLAEAVEAVVPEDLPPGAIGRRRAPPGPDQQAHFTVRYRAQQALDERRPEEPCGSRDGHTLTRERLRNHTTLLARSGARSPLRQTATGAAGA